MYAWYCRYKYSSQKYTDRFYTHLFGQVNFLWGQVKLDSNKPDGTGDFDN